MAVYALAVTRPNLSWTFEPLALALPLIAAGAYLWRWRRVRGERSPRRSHDAPGWRLACFALSLLVLAAALISPLDALADQLLAMHMLQHMLLLDLVPILAILGLTKVLLRLRLPKNVKVTSASAEERALNVAGDGETIDLSGLSGHVAVRAKVGS